mgnify:CR=1 FL=1
MSNKLKMWLARYRTLKMEIDQLQDLIREEVGNLEETIEIDGMKVAYSKPRRSYDYVGFCDQYEIDEEIIKKHTAKPVVNWKAVADEIGIEDGEMDEFTSVADNPSISFKVTELEDV